MYSGNPEHMLKLVPPENLVTPNMRRIQLDGRDAALFAHNLDDADLDFYHGHKDTFKQMWQDQGKKFWIRYVISFRWYIVNHGVLSEFPGKREDFDAIIDQAFIYIHENFVDAKLSLAHGMLLDTFVLSLNKTCIKYLEAKSISKDPFYASATRDVFRRLFGDPSSKISYINVYFTLPLFAFFGGSLIQCLKRWMEASALPEGDESYWEPPQKHAQPKTTPPYKPGDKKKKKKAPSIPATNDGHTVDDDYKIYLEEKLKGHRFGPLFLPTWDFGDPRFVDEQNPLYDPTADFRTDWRDQLTFIGFRKFYDYVKSSDRGDRHCSEFMQYSPDIMVYPPPRHRRIYDEIERSFLDRCEKYYKLGVSVPVEKLTVDDYNAKDMFFIGKREATTRLTPVENNPLPNPCPNIFPQLEPGARLFVIRKHIDGQGLYERLVPGNVMNVHELNELSAEIFGRRVDVESPSQKEQREKSSRLVQDLRQEFKDTDPTPSKRRTKVPKKPKAAKQKSSEQEGDSSPSTDDSKGNDSEEAANDAAEEEVSGAVGGTAEPTPEQAPVEEVVEEEIDSLDEWSDDDQWYFNKRIKPKGPDYPTCIQEMNIVPMSDIDPQVAGILQLMSANIGGLELFELARRKATLPIPDCRDDFTYGTVTGYRAKQMIDSMAVTIAKEWRKARRRRKRAAEAEAAKSKQLKEKKQILNQLAATQDCKKVPRDADKPKVLAAGGLRSCTVCKKVEPKTHVYKKCQRCKTERVVAPRYYCSVDCQAVDWKRQHRKEHNEKLMEIEED